MNVQDTPAFVALYQEQYPRIVAYACRRLGEVADAEDCAGEVFRLAWQQADVPNVGWLFVTAKNLVYAQYRAKARSADLANRLSAGAAGSLPSDVSLGVLAGLDRLTEADRELLMAFYWDDLSGAQCARLLSCSLSAVWVRLHRARRALKTILLAEESGSELPVPPVGAARAGHGKHHDREEDHEVDAVVEAG